MAGHEYNMLQLFKGKTDNQSHKYSQKGNSTKAALLIFPLMY